MNSFTLDIEGNQVTITNPDKPLWPEMGIRKIDYLQYLIDVAPYLLPYTRHRLLTTIRYPHGIAGHSFFQKNRPSYSPEWLQSHRWHDTDYLLLNDLATLVWLGNQACLEFHIPFDRHASGYPSELAFDLDPPDNSYFDLVRETALQVKQVLDSLGLFSLAKTSGASGLQIYLPLKERYTYQQTRQISHFIAQYLTDRYPQTITIERLIKNRGQKLYFDYLQHGEGRTLPAPYSPRACKEATISTPVTWEEIEKGFSPQDFTMSTIRNRLQNKGDLFSPLLNEEQKQTLDELLSFIERHHL